MVGVEACLDGVARLGAATRTEVGEFWFSADAPGYGLVRCPVVEHVPSPDITRGVTRFKCLACRAVVILPLG